MNPGQIYKNRRHHPDRVFVVTGTRNVRVKGQKMKRISGVQIVQDGGCDDTATYLDDTFKREFPFLMFAP